MQPLLVPCSKQVSVFTETAGGVTVGALKKLAASGKIRPDETTVAFITGSGYKTQEAVVQRASKPIVIEPSIAQFRDIYNQLSLATASR